MKLCYLDCFSGISGDMLLGALVDAGLEATSLEAELRKLKLEGWSLEVKRVQRGELAAIKLDFKIRETHHHRTWITIRELIRTSGLAATVRERAEAIFARLAEVEGRIHNVPPDEVHFHEIGAMDSILDVVGASAAVELLGIERIVVSPLNLGGGAVKAAHGMLPVPPPATAALLRGTPVYSSGAEGELVTPTGAAVVATLAAEYGPLPLMTMAAVGYGAGAQDPKERPNVLRVFLGESTERRAGAGDEAITVLEANLDDMSPAVGGYVLEQALAAGALDVFFTPVQMKKNRPGLLLTVLCAPERAEALTRLLFEQTTTLGVRRYRAERQLLERTMEEVETSLGAVRMKLARLNGRLLNVAPEYEDCQRLAQEKGVPLKEVLAEAQFRFRQKQKGRG